jgi:hypothetical protein
MQRAALCRQAGQHAVCGGVSVGARSGGCSRLLAQFLGLAALPLQSLLLIDHVVAPVPVENAGVVNAPPCSRSRPANGRPIFRLEGVFSAIFTTKAIRVKRPRFSATLKGFRKHLTVIYLSLNCSANPLSVALNQAPSPVSHFHRTFRSPSSASPYRSLNVCQ